MALSRICPCGNRRSHRIIIGRCRPAPPSNQDPYATLQEAIQALDNLTGHETGGLAMRAQDALVRIMEVRPAVPAV